MRNPGLVPAAAVGRPHVASADRTAPAEGSGHGRAYRDAQTGGSAVLRRLAPGLGQLVARARPSRYFSSGICPRCQALAPLTDAGKVGHHSTPVDPRLWPPALWPAGLCLNCCPGAGHDPVVADAS